MHYTVYQNQYNKHAFFKLRSYFFPNIFQKKKHAGWKHFKLSQSCWKSVVKECKRLNKSKCPTYATSNVNKSKIISNSKDTFDSSNVDCSFHLKHKSSDFTSNASNSKDVSDSTSKEVYCSDSNSICSCSYLNSNSTSNTKDVSDSTSKEVCCSDSNSIYSCSCLN